MVVLSGDAELAAEEKEKGNVHYKKKEFDEALTCYDKAILHDPTNITFYSNKAAVYMEQGEFAKCREECLKAVEIGKKNAAEPKLIAKALTRIGNSYLKQKSYEDAKKYFLKSLDENHAKEVEEKVTVCEKEIEEQNRLAYVNPDLAVTEKALGDKFFENGDFESSLEHYTEAVKRNPSDPKLYISRAVSLVKLSREEEAIVDCDKCIVMDPSTIKAYLCKGATLESLCRFDCAMDAYEKALVHDPNNRKALKAYYRCLDRDYKRRNDHISVLSRASKDPQLSAAVSRTGLSCLHKKTLSEKTLQGCTRDDITKLVEYGLVELES